MDEEARYTQIRTATIIMLILVGIFTVYVVNSALESIPGPVIIGIDLLVGALFGFVLAAFHSFTIQKRLWRE